MSGLGTVILGLETSCDETAAALVTADGEIKDVLVAGGAPVEYGQPLVIIGDA